LLLHLSFEKKYLFDVLKITFEINAAFPITPVILFIGSKEKEFSI